MELYLFIKYFMIFVIIMELLISYFIISSGFIGYKQNRVSLKQLIISFVLIFTIILATLAISVFIVWF